jgi:hypothetical protein
MKTTREAVYKAIDSERDYQDHLSCDRTELCNAEDKTRPVGDYLVMLDSYTRKAKDAWTDHAGSDAALEVMRKIAGIAVHCMEDNGAPSRK